MKWFLLAAAVVCHVAYADDCVFGTECLTCQNVGSYEDCVAENTYETCTQNNPVCLAEWHFNNNVFKFTSKCTTNTSCDARTNGPKQAECDASYPGGPDNNQEDDDIVGKRRRSLGNHICRKCIPGQCIDQAPTCPHVKHCFTCRAFDDIACWASGQYEKCLGNQMCFYTTRSSGHVERGCIPKKYCSTTFVCDDEGKSNPLPLGRDVSICGAPCHGSCSCKGDPHCKTFDMKTIPELFGECSWHLMTRDGCKGSYLGQTFAIYVKLKKLPSGKIVVDRVKIEYHGKVVVLCQILDEVEIDGISRDISGYSETNPLIVGFFEISLVAGGNAVRVKLENQVEVFWDYDRAVGINVPKGKRGLCGICGNFNDDPKDDLVYGPVDDAQAVCPKKAGLINGKKEGNCASADLKGFSYSWIREGCEEKCGVTANGK